MIALTLFKDPVDILLRIHCACHCIIVDYKANMREGPVSKAWMRCNLHNNIMDQPGVGDSHLVQVQEVGGRFQVQQDNLDKHDLQACFVT